jgi:hypothetical protein
MAAFNQTVGGINYVAPGSTGTAIFGAGQSHLGRRHHQHRPATVGLASISCRDNAQWNAHDQHYQQRQFQRRSDPQRSNLGSRRGIGEAGNRSIDAQQRRQAISAAALLFKAARCAGARMPPALLALSRQDQSETGVITVTNGTLTRSLGTRLVNNNITTLGELTIGSVTINSPITLPNTGRIISATGTGTISGALTGSGTAPSVFGNISTGSINFITNQTYTFPTTINRGTVTLIGATGA